MALSTRHPIHTRNRSQTTWVVKASHACSQCLERWSLELRAYDFTVVHRPGKDNSHVDSLSRLPVSLIALQASMTIIEISKVIQPCPFSLEHWKMVVHLLPLNGNYFPYAGTNKYGNSSCYMKPFSAIKWNLPQWLKRNCSLWSLCHYASCFYLQPMIKPVIKVLSQLLQMAYWVEMAKDTIQYHFTPHANPCQVSLHHCNQSLPLDHGNWLLLTSWRCHDRSKGISTS